MKIVVYLLLLASLAVQAVARDPLIDRAYMKCLYRYVYLNDTLTGKTKDDLLILQIGKSISKCFSHYSNQVDSLSALPNGDMIIGKMIDDAMNSGEFMRGNYPHKRLKTYIYKNYPEGRMTVTDGLILQDYCYVDSLHTQIWTMGDSTREVLGYTCQQATADFRGRHWTAWFATDIPVSDGPWKLGGLPGLILEAYDEGQQHVFTAVGLERVKDEPIIFNRSFGDNQKFEQTNRLEFLRSKKKSLMDLNGYIQMETGIDLSQGKPQKVMRYDLLERDY
ncbi:GLPGLI family protein [Tannerella serpentiformis]|nr:GLPGLI family protein [Tannerella serpentiformis]